MSLFTIILVTIISFLIGFLWYIPGVFGKTWMVLVGLTDNKIKSVSKLHMIFSMILTLLFVFVQTTLLAFVIELFGYRIVDALFIAMMIWLAYMVPVIMSEQFWELRPWKLFWIKSMHYFVVMMVSSVLLFLF